MFRILLASFVILIFKGMLSINMQSKPKNLENNQYKSKNTLETTLSCCRSRHANIKPQLNELYWYVNITCCTGTGIDFFFIESLLIIFFHLFWLMMVSMATAVLPVCRSPMMSSRCPRPMGTRESTALMPVCMGSFTDCLKTREKGL